MNIKVGELKQKASTPLVVFVFMCIVVTVGLLFVLQKSVALDNTVAPVYTGQ